MKRIICAALACAAFSSVAADMVARNGKDSVRITEGACPAKIQALIPEQHRAGFKAGSAVVDGKNYDLCWVLRPDLLVFLQYSDGDGGLVHMTEFKPSVGI